MVSTCLMPNTLGWAGVTQAVKGAAEAISGDELKDETIDVNTSKFNHINDSSNENNNKKYFIMNTLQQQINEKNIFNNKGKIDIKIKE